MQINTYVKKHTRNRLFSMLLSLCLLCGMLPLGTVVLAASDADVWDGSTASGFTDGDGTEGSPYLISTAAQLAYLRDQVNSGETYAGMHFQLTNDLDLDDRLWEPIAGNTGIFSGSFDGQNHMISNYSINGKEDNKTFYDQGLFGSYNGVYLKNLTVSNVRITDTANASTAYYVGAMVGYLYDNTKVENCHVKGVEITVGCFDAGGLVGIVVSNGNEQVTGGGLFDCTAEDILIEPDSVVTKAPNSGGLVGALSAIKDGDAYTLDNCSASGFITTNLIVSWDGSDGGGIGGLAGFMTGGGYDSNTGIVTKNKEFLISNCHADVTITAPNLGVVGGLFGEATALTLENCSASGAVSGTWSIGGLVGAAAGSVLRNCSATGDVTASDWQSGGLVGYGPKSTLESCFATGNVTCTANEKSRIGGLLGNGYSATVTDCFALGDVEGQVGEVGGLVGWVTNDDEDRTGGTFTNCFAFGRVHENESDNEDFAKPLINGMWDASSNDHATAVNCYYNAERSGREDSNGTNKSLEEFKDGTVSNLLGDGFVTRTEFSHPVLSSMYQSNLATLKNLCYSVNGSEPIPVPEFKTGIDTYSILLPRETPRDAVLTLTGICMETGAAIIGTTDATLVNGASNFLSPATITVKAQDGTDEKTYMVHFLTERIESNMKDASISGITADETFIQNEMPSFTAVGPGMDNDNPAIGDERYRPVSWKIDDGNVLSGMWNAAPFTSGIDLSKLSLGKHILNIQYGWEQFGEILENGESTGEYGWMSLDSDLPEELIKTVPFTIVPVVTYTLTFDTDGGTPVPSAQTLEAGAKPATVSNPAKKGYSFSGWYNDTAKVNLSDFTMPEHDVVLKAKWEKKPATPSQPTKPSQPGKPDVSSTVQTGDSSPVWPFWVALTSLFGIGLMISFRKRQS